VANADSLVVGLNVSGLLYMGGYNGRNMFGLASGYRELIDQLTNELLRSTQATVLLVPHVFGSEREEEACASVLQSAGARFPGRVLAVQEALTESELKWVIGRTSIFVGSRMHACIAALSQCVPAIGLAYSDKFVGVFESAGVADSVVDLRKSSAADVVARTLAAVEQRKHLRQRLAARIPDIRNTVVTTFGELWTTSRVGLEREA